MKKKLVIIACFMCLGLSACAKENTEISDSNTTITYPEESEAPATAEPTATKKVQLPESKPVTFSRENSIYDFSKEEIELYENFSKTFDKKLFIGIEPITILKMYIQYGIDGGWEQEFELYNKESIPSEFTKEHSYSLYLDYLKLQEELEEIKTEDGNTTTFKSILEIAKANFTKLDEGQLKENEDGTATLTFYSDVSPEEPVRTDFVKHADGYWEIKYYPFY